MLLMDADADPRYNQGVSLWSTVIRNWTYSAVRISPEEALQWPSAV